MAVVAALALSACEKNPDTKAGSSRSSLRAGKPKPADVIKLAEQYEFGNPTGPVAAISPIPGQGVEDDEVPTITLARAVPKRSPAPAGS